MQKLVGDKISCETVGELLSVLKNIDPSLRAGGDIGSMLEISLWEDDQTKEQIISITED